MGKRSSFERRDKDFYPTPSEAVTPLLPFLQAHSAYCEPCVGDGALVNVLPIQCVSAFDLEPRASYPAKDALLMEREDLNGAEVIITNPPWSRDILHPLIERFRSLAPTWLLFDADWMHTKQAAPYLPYCSHIVSVGRVKWIPGSKHTGKDNCCWYRFQKYPATTTFHGR